MGLEGRGNRRRAGKGGWSDAVTVLAGSAKDLGSSGEQGEVLRGSETGMRTSPTTTLEGPGSKASFVFVF